MTGLQFARHVAGWWWHHTAGRVLCAVGLHDWTDAGDRPTCSRCPTGGHR